VLTTDRLGSGKPFVSGARQDRALGPGTKDRYALNTTGHDIARWW
jgi:hypothetical protein